MSTFKSYNEFINELIIGVIKCWISSKALKSFISDLKENGIKYTVNGNTFELEDTFKAKMAIKMVRERFGVQSVYVYIKTD
jgi:retron-type reverse transcriptase